VKQTAARKKPAKRAGGHGGVDLTAVRHAAARLVNDEQWARVAAELPPRSRFAPAHRIGDREALAGILEYYRLGSWHRLPREYGNHLAYFRRHRTWAASGLLSRLFAAWLETLDGETRARWAQKLNVHEG